ncbi:hypothetical protein [Aquisalibacillus elongatus]|uniref:Uncharacterized protein n=1 Tax=Aquisalibacillus elongatus TaxID=485577 RepID=A0A3N5BLV7_9BACI|nr:hypothetical protein [Aquisalibacillus elongatus]RPF56160.1 hypothetical protein EDC24_1049 [Aquisalibacillus elongatus]
MKKLFRKNKKEKVKIKPKREKKTKKKYSLWRNLSMLRKTCPVEEQTYSVKFQLNKQKANPETFGRSWVSFL